MEKFVLTITQNSLYLVLILSAPAVLVALCVGLIISLVQATTQIQEQTLTFVPKLAAVMITLVISGGWMLAIMKSFIVKLLTEFPIYLM